MWLLGKIKSSSLKKSNTNIKKPNCTEDRVNSDSSEMAKSRTNDVKPKRERPSTGKVSSAHPVLK